MKYEIKCSDGILEIPEEEALESEVLQETNYYEMPNYTKDQIAKIFRPNLNPNSLSKPDILFLSGAVNELRIEYLIKRFSESAAVILDYGLVEEEITELYDEGTIPDEAWQKVLLPNMQMSFTLPFAQKWIDEGLIDWPENMVERFFFLMIEKDNSVAVTNMLRMCRIEPQIHHNKAIRMCCDKGLIKCFQILIKDPRVNPSADNNYCIRKACEKGYLDIVRWLLTDPRVNPAVENNTCFVHACYANHVEIVKLLLRHPKVKPNANDNDGLMMAISNQSVEIVELLLGDKRVNPGTRNNEAIRLAGGINNVQIVELLLANNKVDPTVEENLPLKKAIMTNSTDIAITLLSDPRIDPSINKGEALILACGCGLTDVVIKILADKRIQESSDVDYVTATTEAEKNNHNDILKILLKHREINYE